MFSEKAQRIAGKLLGWIAGCFRAVLFALLRLLLDLMAAGAGWLLRRLPSRGADRLRDLAGEIRFYYNSRNRVYRRSILASVIIHTVCLICFASIPSCNRPVRWESASPIPVALVNLPVPTVAKKITQPKPELPKPKPEVKPKETPKPKPKPPVTEKKKKEVPKVEKKQAPKPKPAPPEPAAKEQKQLTSRVDEATFAYDYYLQIISGQISQAWQPPAGLMGMSTSAGSVLRFRIDRLGRVSGIGVEEPSPINRFDESARMAIMAAQPFPPFPPAYKGQWLTVHLRFALTDWQATQTR